MEYRTAIRQPVSAAPIEYPKKRQAASRSFRLFGFFFFSPVKVNELSMDWDNRENFDPHHYAFLVTDEEFDQILGRVKAEGMKYGSGPMSQDDMHINHLHMGRGFYYRDPDGHSFEVITHTYV